MDDGNQITEAAVAIEGVRRTMKELVDGTIRVQIDIEPRFKGDFHRLFPSIDMPVALAPLNVHQNVPHGTHQKTSSESKASAPRLSQYAALLCQSGTFQRWLVEQGFLPHTLMPETEIAQELSARWVRNVCKIDSRSELDTSRPAAQLFHDEVRKPYNEWAARRGG